MGMCEVLTESSFIQSVLAGFLDGEYKQKNRHKCVYVLFFLISSSFPGLLTLRSALQSRSRMYIIRQSWCNINNCEM